MMYRAHLYDSCVLLIVHFKFLFNIIIIITITILYQLGIESYSWT